MTEQAIVSEFNVDSLCSACWSGSDCVGTLPFIREWRNCSARSCFSAGIRSLRQEQRIFCLSQRIRWRPYDVFTNVGGWGSSDEVFPWVVGEFPRLEQNRVVSKRTSVVRAEPERGDQISLEGADTRCVTLVSQPERILSLEIFETSEETERRLSNSRLALKPFPGGWATMVDLCRWVNRNTTQKTNAVYPVIYFVVFHVHCLGSNTRAYTVWTISDAILSPIYLSLEVIVNEEMQLFLSEYVRRGNIHVWIDGFMMILWTQWADFLCYIDKFTMLTESLSRMLEELASIGES